MEEIHRCRWCNLNNPLYVEYHDKEWGVPVHDDRKLFEMLILEGFQAGLSWECVLNKREAFRREFDGFDPIIVASYDDAKLEELAACTGIIRNSLKIRASVCNACRFLEIQDECGSFDSFLWDFCRNQLGLAHDCPEPLVHENTVTTSPLSDALSKELRRRGFKFVGSTIVYSLLQAVGVIDSHDDCCTFRIKHQ